MARTSDKVNPAFPYWRDVRQTIECRCGAVFRGRDKLRMTATDYYHEVDRECPGCGHLVVVRVSNDPELWSVGKD